jgi:hypothetical protein
MFPKPTLDYVTQRIAEFNDDPQYYGAERAVDLVFRQWPQNTVDEQVLVKVVVLNRLYSTNIYDPYTVANHIVAKGIDHHLASGDPTLVDDLARVAFGTRTRVLFSFATKYCAWHQPNRYQIYDSFVDWLLWEYRKQFEFAKFRRYELRQYPDFLRIVRSFADAFSLQAFTPKHIDKFLWIEGMRQWEASGDSAPTPEGSGVPA